MEAQVSLPEGQQDKRPMEEQITELKAVAAQIWASRPAFVCHLTRAYSFSAFTDCFSAAMLLNPETSPE